MAPELLPDQLWELIRPFVPRSKSNPKVGRSRLADRLCLAGIVFVLRIDAVPSLQGERGRSLTVIVAVAPVCPVYIPCGSRQSRRALARHKATNSAAARSNFIIFPPSKSARSAGRPSRLVWRGEAFRTGVASANRVCRRPRANNFRKDTQ